MKYKNYLLLRVGSGSGEISTGFGSGDRPQIPGTSPLVLELIENLATNCVYKK